MLVHYIRKSNEGVMEEVKSYKHMDSVKKK